MAVSPLLDSTIIFISNNDLKTRRLLNVIRRREVSRSVHWLRSLEQVKRYFLKQGKSTQDQSPPVAIILDYDLEGVSVITRFLNEKDILKYSTLYSLASVEEEVDSLGNVLKSVGK